MIRQLLRTHLRLLLLLSCTTASINYCPAQEYPVPRTMPSITRELITHAALRDALDVSPQQLEGIKLVLQNQKLRELEGAVSKAQFGPPGSIDPKELATQVDAAFRAELGQVLEKEQIKALIPTSMKLQFQGGMLPFENKAILHYCRVPKEVADEIAPQIARMRVDVAQEIRTVVAKHANQVLLRLPPASKALFVNYAGNEFLPGVSPDSTIDVSSIPFGPRVQAYSTIDLAIENDGLRTRIRLTGDQYANLKSILDARSEAFSKALSSGSHPIGDSLIAYFKELQQSTYKKLRGVLKDEQFLLIAQNRVSIEFENNFNAPFEQKPVVDYLKLTPQELDDVRHAASAEQAKMNDELDQIHFKTFDSLCKKLPPAPEKAMRSLFESVWKSYPH